VNAPDVGVDQHAHGPGRLARDVPADGAKTAGELYGRALLVIAAALPVSEKMALRDDSLQARAGALPAEVAMGAMSSAGAAGRSEPQRHPDWNHRRSSRMHRLDDLAAVMPCSREVRKDRFMIDPSWWVPGRVTL